MILEELSKSFIVRDTGVKVAWGALPQSETPQPSDFN
jgi:hypothetical protein